MLDEGTLKFLKQHGIIQRLKQDRINFEPMDKDRMIDLNLLGDVSRHYLPVP